MDVLLNTCFPLPDYGYTSKCPPDMLERMVELGVRLERPDFLQKVEKVLIFRLEKRTVSASQALDIGEKFSLQKFLRRAYFTVMLGAFDSDRTAATSSAIYLPYRLDSNLSSLHVGRILQGHFSLCMLWGRISRMHLHQAKSSSTHALQSFIAEFELNQVPPANIWKRLEIMLNPPNGSRATCIEDSRGLKELQAKFWDTLPTYFVDK
jgi:hypothetical protein